MDSKTGNSINVFKRDNKKLTSSLTSISCIWPETAFINEACKLMSPQLGLFEPIALLAFSTVRTSQRSKIAQNTTHIQLENYYKFIFTYWQRNRVKRLKQRKTKLHIDCTGARVCKHHDVGPFTIIFDNNDNLQKPLCSQSFTLWREFERTKWIIVCNNDNKLFMNFDRKGM